MTKQFKRGVDVDTDALAESLRDVADALDNGSVAVKKLKESHETDCEDLSVAKLELEYYAEDSSVITPIKYIQ